MSSNGEKIGLEFDGLRVTGFSSVIVDNARATNKRYSDDSRLGLMSWEVSPCSSRS